MSTESVDQFEALVAARMKRFHIILEKAQFQFKQYQHDGVEWCVNNELRPNPVSNIRGGFIADEMGLGKTIMMIGTMFVNYLQRTLIVVPPVLIQQWYKEIFSASGHKALLYYGEDKKNITLEDIERAPIVLTTYNSLFPSQCLLKKIVWSRVIFDEAHHLRNCGTRRFKSCKQIKARVRWLVTGTPIQNKKQDFYNLCSAVGMKPSFYTDAANLRTIGKHFVLRRTKATVGILLPPVCKNNKIVKWKNKKEMMLSEEIHALLPNQTFVSGAKRRKLAEAIGSKAFVSILRARQSCVLPSLMRWSIEHWLKKGLISSEYLEALDYTSKLDAVIELIVSRKDNGKGKIIFCHYHGEIDIIAQKLVASGLKKVVTYDGRNSGGENLASLAEPADALVIQIQTGCEGLNLQHNFSEIYFVSPHWNPCVEDQAIARCHRIGQLKPIDVFKFEMCGFAKDEDSEVDPCTLEKYVNKVQDVKREISRQILEFNL
jgi:SNF2 family DNA or RNA helicase